MRGRTQLPVGDAGFAAPGSPQGGTAGRANNTACLQDAGRLP